MHWKETNQPVLNGWWESCRRHPNLTLRATVPLSHAKAVSTDPEMLECYCDLLKTTMKENKLLDEPCQIFDLDETGCH